MLTGLPQSGQVLSAIQPSTALMSNSVVEQSSRHREWGSCLSLLRARSLISTCHFAVAKTSKLS